MNLPPIIADVVKHKDQIYDTVGNYTMIGDEVNFTVSSMNNPLYEFLVLLHEEIEWFGIWKDKIPLRKIDAFDISYEKSREKGLAKCGCKITKTSEAGDDVHAPYHKWHVFATMIERLLCAKYGGNWEKYSKKVESL